MSIATVSTVVWDGGTESALCRDERCTIVGVHLVHDIIDTPCVVRARQFSWGWSLDPFEPSSARPSTPKRRRGETDGRSGVSPRHAETRVLDEVILELVSSYTVKSSHILYYEVENVFGSCEPRRLARRLEALRELGKIVLVGVGAFQGYTRPGSKLLHDPSACEEILWRQSEAA